MQITAFALRDGSGPSAWSLQRCEFRPFVNLIVGPSGVGKTKLLNGLFNIAKVAAQDFMLGPGAASVEFLVDDVAYKWTISIEERSDKRSGIAGELLEQVGGRKLIERDVSSTKLNGERIPKLPPDASALRILREEDLIKPIVRGFSRFRRRAFASDALDKARSVSTIPTTLIEACRAGADVSALYSADISLSSTIKVISEFYKKEYKVIIDQFKRVFPSVEDIRIVEGQQLGIGVLGNAPVMLMKEADISTATPIMEWSSGMLKVLLLITDVMTQPRPSTYIIDEYENSLGVNAIDFFPGLVNELGEGIQFFLTTHHPMLINSLPITDWIVLGRKGSSVRALYGDGLKDRYGVSHHEQYVKLLNDPFYQRGDL